MPLSDRERWNDKYSRGEHSAAAPTEVFTSLVDWLPQPGRALDLAGGAGRHSIWLAQHGWQVTLTDISDVALQMARDRAGAEGLPLEICAIDLERESPPSGPWQLIVCVHFLHRPVFSALPKLLAPDGVFVFIHPTAANTERHAKPPARFLLGDGELPTLTRGLEVLYYTEGWNSDDRHEAVLVAGVE